MAHRRRDVLMRAASGDWTAVATDDKTPTAVYRAARALVALGLAEMRTASKVVARAECRGDHCEAEAVTRYCIRHDISGGRTLIRLTALGRAVVAFFRRALEAGKAIRWQRFLDAVEAGRVSLA